MFSVWPGVMKDWGLGWGLGPSSWGVPAPSHLFRAEVKGVLRPLSQ